MRVVLILLLVIPGGLVAFPTPVYGYVGPGAGLTIIGAALAFVGAVVLGLFGFVWYPFKRLFRFLFRRGESEPRSDEAEP